MHLQITKAKFALQELFQSHQIWTAMCLWIVVAAVCVTVGQILAASL